MSAAGTRVAVVTGGAGTLGAAIGARLASDGFEVTLFDIDGEAVAAAARRLSELTGREVAGWRVDVGDAGAVHDAVTRITGRGGRLDCLVNNAAVNLRGALAEQAPQDWDAMMSVNVRGPMLLCQAALPWWRRNGWGRVINLGSRTWLGGGPTGYVTSKAAVVGLTRTLAVELGPLGVTVNAVAPSMVATPFTRGGRSDAEFDGFMRRHLAMTPLGRLARPEDVADAVAFLAGDQAGFITGEVLHVCGGAQLAPSA
ncbi:SDR family NAD(P)-dependent oxidoreductase [Streptosporangium roseum]|uniref:SDR family NAD(P)-dependent oxidoreductase n=1 Tax=Streptosporangium roseum TaxID=2001 RepID=UPI003334A4A1